MLLLRNFPDSENSIRTPNQKPTPENGIRLRENKNGHQKKAYGLRKTVHWPVGTQNFLLYRIYLLSLKNAFINGLHSSSRIPVTISVLG